MQNFSITDLQDFLEKASLNTYAINKAPEETAERPGFKDINYQDGDWNYRDSYTGSMRAWGTELIRFQGKPVWNSVYGGGMAEKYLQDKDFALETFKFLKSALAAPKELDFQLRGPASLEDGEWVYKCDYKGNIELFSGHEEISRNGELVFFHDFLGGLILE